LKGVDYYIEMKFQWNYYSLLLIINLKISKWNSRFIFRDSRRLWRN
jgi:hypothetical protein